MNDIQASEQNVKSPTTYGKEAYEEYRKKEKKNKNKDPNKANKYSERQTRNNVSRQDKVPGQKRTKIVSDFRYAAVIAQLLKNLNFPAHKNAIIQFTLDQDSESIDSSQVEEMLSLLQQIQEKEYKNVAEIIETLDLVREIP